MARQLAAESNTTLPPRRTSLPCSAARLRCAGFSPRGRNQSPYYGLWSGVGDVVAAALRSNRDKSLSSGALQPDFRLARKRLTSHLYRFP